MSIVERISELQKERKLTNKELEVQAGLSNSTVSQWKTGKGKPSLENILKVATFFEVSTDYLLCLSDVRTYAAIEKSLSPEEELLLQAYHAANAQGRFRIIQVCMNEMDMAVKGEVASVG